MRVISFGIYSNQPEYPRHRNLLAGLKRNGVQVLECNYPMASNFQSRLKSVTSLWGRLLFGLKLAWSFIYLTVRFLRMPAADAVIVGNPGFFHVFLARFLMRFRNRKAVLVYDIFYSLYDTVVCDRKLVGETNLTARVIWRMEEKSLKTADICLIDTFSHADYFTEEFNVDRSTIERVFVGSTFEASSQPVAAVDTSSGRFRVLFIGTYIPLQGVDIILRAARELSEENGIDFTLVGRGQLRQELEEQASAWGLQNVIFVDWVPAPELRSFIRTFQLSLGIFGETAKTGRVIPFKIFDTCSAGVPFVTSESPAIREVFTHRRDSYLVPAGNPQALAAAVQVLQQNSDLRVRLAESAHRIALDLFSPESAVKDLLRILDPQKKDQALD